jgi:hypothetical protein
MNEQWRIVSEGVLALHGTGYEIKFEPAGNIFRIYHHGKALAGLWAYNLEGAKKSTLHHMRQMIEMGIEP